MSDTALWIAVGAGLPSASGALFPLTAALAIAMGAGLPVAFITPIHPPSPQRIAAAMARSRSGGASPLDRVASSTSRNRSGQSEPP